MKVLQYKNFFILGIKGIAMANLAVILKKMKKNVFGVDNQEKFITDRLLKENKIEFLEKFDHSLLKRNIDLIIYSAAHQGISNPLLIEAKKRGIKLISQADFIGQLMSQFKIKIAVSGCHGKTTTTSLLAYALNKLEKKPSYLVGASYFTDYQGADYQKKDYFVVEADEYGINPPIDKTPKFFKLNPDWIICTNIDFDHPDVYEDLKQTKKAFLKFFNKKKLVLNFDDINLIQSFKRLKKNKIISYGFSQGVDFLIKNYQIKNDLTSFKVNNYDFEIKLFGRHNVLNATAVISLLFNLGFKYQEIKRAVRNFAGAQRRLNLVYQGRFLIYDDYGHHPTEIKSTIEALRLKYPNQRIIVIFQPHTYSRTQVLFKEFRQSLTLADYSFILPIFASARESSLDFNISSKDLVKGLKNLFYVNNNQKLIDKIKRILKKNDLILTIGAGDIYKVIDQLKTLWIIT